jgi:hypothetical protein
MQRLSAETKQDLEQNRQDLEKAVGRCRAQQLVLQVFKGWGKNIPQASPEMMRTELSYIVVHHDKN